MVERIRRGFEIFGQFVTEDEAHKVYLELKKYFEPVKEKIVPKDIQILKMLGEGSRPSEIGKALKMKKRAVFSSIERQQRKGYLKRVERGKYSLTEEGKKIIAA